jgi:hypothetical protein
VYGAASAALVVASILPTLLFVGMMMGGIIGVMSLVSRKDPYDEIERGDLYRDRDTLSAGASTAEDSHGDDPAAEHAERELEIRQMIEARSARLVRNGGQPLDVEVELARLLQADPVAMRIGEQNAVGEQTRERAERELEIRQMIEARSARIVRRGGQPLDVESEVARLLGEAPGAKSGDQRPGASAG